MALLNLSVIEKFGEKSGHSDWNSSTELYNEDPSTKAEIVTEHDEFDAVRIDFSLYRILLIQTVSALLLNVIVLVSILIHIRRCLASQAPSSSQSIEKHSTQSGSQNNVDASSGQNNNRSTDSIVDHNPAKNVPYYRSSRQYRIPVIDILLAVLLFVAILRIVLKNLFFIACVHGVICIVDNQLSCYAQGFANTFLHLFTFWLMALLAQDRYVKRYAEHDYLSKCSHLVLYVSLCCIGFLISMHLFGPVYGFSSYRFRNEELTCAVEWRETFSCAYYIYTVILVGSPAMMPLTYWSLKIVIRELRSRLCSAFSCVSQSNRNSCGCCCNCFTLAAHFRRDVRASDTPTINSQTLTCKNLEENNINDNSIKQQPKRKGVSTKKLSEVLVSFSATPLQHHQQPQLPSNLTEQDLENNSLTKLDSTTNCSSCSQHKPDCSSTKEQSNNKQLVEQITASHLCSCSNSTSGEQNCVKNPNPPPLNRPFQVSPGQLPVTSSATTSTLSSNGTTVKESEVEIEHVSMKNVRSEVDTQQTGKHSSASTSGQSSASSSCSVNAQKISDKINETHSIDCRNRKSVGFRSAVLQSKSHPTTTSYGSVTPIYRSSSVSAALARSLILSESNELLLVGIVCLLFVLTSIPKILLDGCEACFSKQQNIPPSIPRDGETISKNLIGNGVANETAFNESELQETIDLYSTIIRLGKNLFSGNGFFANLTSSISALHPPGTSGVVGCLGFSVALLNDIGHCFVLPLCLFLGAKGARIAVQPLLCCSLSWLKRTRKNKNRNNIDKTQNRVFCPGCCLVRSSSSSTSSNENSIPSTRYNSVVRVLNLKASSEQSNNSLGLVSTTESTKSIEKKSRIEKIVKTNDVLIVLPVDANEAPNVGDFHAKNFHRKSPPIQRQQIECSILKSKQTASGDNCPSPIGAECGRSVTSKIQSTKRFNFGILQYSNANNNNNNSQQFEHCIVDSIPMCQLKSRQDHNGNRIGNDNHPPPHNDTEMVKYRSLQNLGAHSANDSKTTKFEAREKAMKVKHDSIVRSLSVHDAVAFHST